MIKLPICLAHPCICTPYSASGVPAPCAGSADRTARSWLVWAGSAGWQPSLYPPVRSQGSSKAEETGSLENYSAFSVVFLFELSYQRPPRSGWPRDRYIYIWRAASFASKALCPAWFRKFFGTPLSSLSIHPWCRPTPCDNGPTLCFFSWTVGFAGTILQYQAF